MKLQNTLLMAAFSLIMSATLMAQNTAINAPSTKNIVITSLPYTISDPGTYVLIGNLTCNVPKSVGITIVPTLPGPIVLDLKGFTLSGPSTGSVGISIGDIAGDPITVKNGTLTSFGYGLQAGGVGDIDLNNLTMTNITSAINSTCINIGPNTSCTVRNCTFSNAMYGIASDGASGNRYINLTFTDVTWSLFISGSPVHVDNCQFAGLNN